MSQKFKTPRCGLSHTGAMNGSHVTDGIPHGFTSLTPFIAVSPAAEAIEFYRSVFGARLASSTLGPGGIVLHAELDLGTGRLQLGEPNPDFGLAPQPGTDAASFSLGLYHPDVDEVVAAAEAAGATIREPLQDFASGDRFASILDPFGIRWSLMTRTEDISEEESAARVAAWAAEQGWSEPS